ncbi:F-type H+-transporting ATPase subunit a [Candidatus Gastranaerophilus sp. (ex Termes propinquus)]|nr:F-type H+-transporting ATPase subunit a [Candidatus Gastranaerophilus sp. (ex Termes propinquus)]
MELHIGQHLTVNIFGLVAHLDTLITMWVAMGLILLFALLATRGAKIVPSKLQAVFENIVTIFVGMTKDMGKNAGSHAVLLMSLFLFIIVANLIGQLPWKLIHLPHGELASPTNDLNLTGALAVVVLVYYISQGVIEKGIGYFKHYFQPSILMAPLNIMEDIIRPMTLAVRLFANILAGEILILVLGGLILMFLTPEGAMAFTENILGNILPSTFVYNTGLFLGSLLPLPIMFFELFVAFIQALVFTLLASAYISIATAKNH